MIRIRIQRICKSNRYPIQPESIPMSLHNVLLPFKALVICTEVECEIKETKQRRGRHQRHRKDNALSRKNIGPNASESLASFPAHHHSAFEFLWEVNALVPPVARRSKASRGCLEKAGREVKYHRRKTREGAHQ